MLRPTAEIKFEEYVEDELRLLGWDHTYSFKRENLSDAIDYKTLKERIITLNDISEMLADKAILEIKKISGTAIERNLNGSNMLTNGVKVFDESQKRRINVDIVSKDITQNHYGVIRQFELSDRTGNKRFPDIVCFINGLPISILELKAPDAYERLPDAFKQNDSLKNSFPSLYTFNLFDFLSNNIETRYGSITATFKKYFNGGKWNADQNPVNTLFDKKMINDFIDRYSFFDNDGSIKYVAGLHQIRAVEATISKMKKGGHKGGVIWHTQGSGKSVTMLMLTKAIINIFTNSTTLIVTDRNSLDRQLFSRFSNASTYLFSEPIEVKSRNDLSAKLNDKKHFGIYFTTVQKFSEETGELSLRDDIFVLIDEAHRTQNNIEGRNFLDKNKKEFNSKFGFAKFMRDAFPNAILTGFTGTPLMGAKTTIDIFGGYNDKYSMNDSVADGSTVPIFYESRKVEINLDKKYLEIMDDIQHTYAKTLDENDIHSENKMRTLLKSVQTKRILEDPEVIMAKSKDILNHLETRKNLLHGKAMIVASSRRSAFEYYKSLVSIQPKLKKNIILVMTHNNKDNSDEKNMIVPDFKKNEVASEFRKSDSKYKIAIVVDMWLTGFDVPDLDVMYIDKVIKWHNLMQAIARVNRTYEDNMKVKESGLIVDYLGIWKYLSDALAQYANGNGSNVDIIPEDIERAKIKLLDEIDIMNSVFIKDIKSFPNLNSREQYKYIMNGLNTVLGFDKKKTNEFILKTRVISRLMKISFTVISKEISSIVKSIQVINYMVTTKNTTDDNKLKITIEEIKRAIERAIDAKESDVTIRSTKISKDINKVAYLLESEAEQLRSNNPKVSSKLLQDSINGKISEVKKYRPIFAKKASDKLRDILSRLEKEEKLEKILDMLFDLSKELTTKMNEDPEFKDPQLQAFFSILSDDAFLDHNKNSEVLKAISEDLMKTVKDNMTDQFYKNKKVKKLVALELKKILKNKYNYPPEKLGGISSILINRINKTIEYNSEYYINKKEVI